ncbi:MAG: DUF72 domain-containing protein [Archaeoglobus sp.]|nr:DUF72 domain-containing protein [Archaeoglobus sp.]
MKVGCCGFAVAFDKYVKSLDVVEVQQTFYKPPKLETAEKWRQKADSINKGFEFTVKAFQVITHPRSSPTYRKAKLEVSGNVGFFNPVKEVFEAWEKTKEIAEILRADKIVFQTPSSFKMTEENLKRVDEFFSSIDGKFTFIWEPRDYSEALMELFADILKKHGIVHCVDPFASEPAFLPDIAYFRLHGAYKGKRIVYSYTYSDEELNQLGEKTGKYPNPYVMFNNKSMYNDALRFRELVNHKKG